MRGPCGWIAPDIDHYSLLNGVLHIKSTLEDGAHTYALRDPNKHVVTAGTTYAEDSLLLIANCIAKYGGQRTPMLQYTPSVFATVGRLPSGRVALSWQTATLFDNEQFTATIFGSSWSEAEALVQTLTWKVDIYTYITGARPDQPQFEADGGAVMVIVHSGHLSFDCRKGHSTYRVTAPPPVAAQKQLPPTGSGVKNEDYWNYSISYQEVMNMFNNGGNGTLDFDARYKEDFSRREPLTGMTLSNGVEFGTKFESDNADPPKFNLAGVSIFRANTPDAFPAKFSFEANSAWGFVEEGFSSNKKVEVQVDINRDV
ncbi:hypothetical protein EYR38_010634 [Pleurotus pulmonarius]|nr:hypothetical protein EYR38_010634 [Pleurotus pulmonarius]